MWCSVARSSRPDFAVGKIANRIRYPISSEADIKQKSGCSVARSSRLLWEQEVAGSNPATPTNRT